MIPVLTTTATDFVVAKVTPTLETNLGYKLFLMFGTINIGGMAVFSLCVCSSYCLHLINLLTLLLNSLIPETKGRSLEEMDIIFGSVQADKRIADIAAQERGEFDVDVFQLRRRCVEDSHAHDHLYHLQPLEWKQERVYPSTRKSDEHPSPVTCIISIS